MLYQITKSETNWFQGSTCSYQQELLWASALSLSPAESPQAERLKSCTPAFQGNSTSSVNSWLQLRGEFWHGEILQSNCIAPCIKPNSSCFQDKKKASHQFCYHIVIKHFFFVSCAGFWLDSENINMTHTNKRVPYLMCVFLTSWDTVKIIPQAVTLCVHRVSNTRHCFDHANTGNSDESH